MNINLFKNSLWRTVKKVANLNFAIFILLCIASFSIIGSVIEQEQSLEYYKINYPFQSSSIGLNWRIIISLGLDHIYDTWWFLLIILIFSGSIVICTFSSQLPGLKNARRWKFLNFNSNIGKTVHSSRLNYNSLSNMIYALNYKNYYVFHKKLSLYAYKGLLGRISPIFVHVSIIITLIGFVFSILGSFTVQEMIPIGESIHLKNIIKSGLYSKLPNHILCKVDSFFITYNANNSIKQFFSDISILNTSGHTWIRKMIQVNSPLRFNSLTFYQTDWNINALRISINIEHIIQQPLQKIKIGNQFMWIGTLSLNSQQSLIFLIFNLKDPILIYDEFGQNIEALDINNNLVIHNNSFNIQGILVSTGLQIKVDPGIRLIYFGFLIIMISTVFSYISYCQIWVNMNSNVLDINGSVNRGMLHFEEDLSIIQIKYQNYTSYNNIKF
uniref:Cytochrome c biogenesis protein CcsB n=1 Tax=Callithamnion tetricum TaxID=193179 RepID=A0A4D6WLX0_9FLOR|nr:cytochrome c biogenesis protein ccs1 [Callithamnion tetricum]